MLPPKYARCYVPKFQKHTLKSARQNLIINMMENVLKNSHIQRNYAPFKIVTPVFQGAFRVNIFVHLYQVKFLIK